MPVIILQSIAVIKLYMTYSGSTLDEGMLKKNIPLSRHQFTNYFIIYHYVDNNTTCTANINYFSIPITWQNTYHTSHCSYCTCHHDNKISCHQDDFEGSTQTLCTNCEFIKIPRKCSYCVDPQDDLGLTIPSGIDFPVVDFMCLSCECSQEGKVQCDYNNTQQCGDHKSCQKYFKQLKNETIPYQCKNCVFDGKELAPYTTWTLAVDQDLAKCSCQVNGVVDCKVGYGIDEFAFVIYCRNCSSYDMVGDRFKRQGM